MSGRFGKAPGKERGAALLIVVLMLLLIAPILIGVFLKNETANNNLGVSSAMMAAAKNAGERELADFVQEIATSLNNGLFEYTPSPPGWFVPSSKLSEVDVQSSGFWATCASHGLCEKSTLIQSPGLNNDTKTVFTVEKLVTPAGMVNPAACNESGYVAVFYNVFIHVQASNIPAGGGSTLQAIYASCQKN